MKPRLLDLGCGAGGATKGYQLAGFHVTGVDIRPQPHYCGDAFILGDMLDVDLAGYDAIHASPPCQGYSRMRHLPWLRGREYPLLIDPVRARLQETGLPWVIENVQGAHLPAGWLCGQMWDLPFYRHRSFETSFLWLAPSHPKHRMVLQHGRGFRAFGDLTVSRMAPGLPWMTVKEARQAVPAVYTLHIGEALLRVL